MLRRFAIACLILAAGIAAVAAPPVDASAARSCSLAGQQRTLGPTYVTALHVTAVGCRAGKRLVRAYFRCRVEAGGKDGRCAGGARGYSCTEQRFNLIETQYDARVKCRKGTARVSHDYTQFT